MRQRKIESKRFHREFDEGNLGFDQWHLYHYFFNFSGNHLCACNEVTAYVKQDQFVAKSPVHPVILER